jgi:hypothetical protein
MSRARAPSFARTGFTSPLGKLDDKLPDGRVESVVIEKFTQRVADACAQAGFQAKPAAEAVRDMVRVVALGPDMAKRMYGEGVLVVLKTIVGMSDTK